MNLQKRSHIALFALLCILLNYGGKMFANACHLPFWLDSLGTVLMAYALGSVCGAIVGVTMNILYTLHNPISYIYSLTSIAIAVIVGLVARRKWFDTLFGTMSASVLVTLAAITISLPLSWTFSGGRTGNIWGDGVAEYLMELRVPALLCSIAGHFYIEFLDKIIALFLLFATIRLWRTRRYLRIRLLYLRRRLRQRRVAKAGLLLALCVALTAMQEVHAAAVTGYVQTVYSSANGLPCGEANDIVQTPDGILWIGTYAGLYRYNGSEFRWMNEYESVRSVNCLYVDEEGRLWIGTNDSGLSICINEQISTVLDSSNGLPSNSVRAIVKSADGYYYIGTSQGMMVLELNGGLRTLNLIPEIGYTVRLTADAEGTVAAVLSDGSLAILKERALTDLFRLPQGNAIYTCCTFGEDGRLYVGTSKNLITVFERTQAGFAECDTLTAGSLAYLKCLYFSDGQFFVCADNGIGTFDVDGSFTFINTAGFNNSIDNMTTDYQGNRWFTSSRQGLLRLSASPFTNLYASWGLQATVVNSVEFWREGLYVGTDRGLDVLQDGKRVENSFSRLLNGVRIRCIKTDSKGRLWLCTYGKGLLELHEDGTIVSYDGTNGMFGDWVRVVTELSDGTIAAAGGTGLVYIRDGTVQSRLRYNKELPSSQILCLTELPDGTLLAGSDGDGLEVIQNGTVVRQISKKDGLTSDVIMRTVPSSDGAHIFIVTSNSLCVMDADYTVRQLKSFPYFNNYDVCTGTNGLLFVTGSAGIHVVNEEALLSGGELHHYDLLDAKSGLNAALTANSWNYCDDNGDIYLACGTGVFVVNMSNYLSGVRSYRMMLSSIRLDNVSYPVERGEPFIIKRETAKIEIFPEVVNYTVLDPTVTYYLEGFDREKTVIPQSELSSIVYTNLPSGEYVFHLAVLDKDENILEQSSYDIIKEKKIYDNRYFKFYMLIVAMIAIAWFTWFIARTQVQRTIEMQKQQLAFAQEQMENLTLFAKFTNTIVADAISKKSVDFRPHLKDCTILFSDIRGFTAISDAFRRQFGRNSAAKIIEFLNDYMGRMVSCISIGGGTVDKFEGDAIMAVWGMLRKGELRYERMDDGDPYKDVLRQEHLKHIRQDALDCIQSALAMRCALMEYNALADADTDSPMPHIRIGCGINSGRVTAGILGGEQKLEYTAIGDAVNLAQRTEAASKFCGADILISEDTHALIRDTDIILERIPVAVSVQGKGDLYFYAVVNMPSLDLTAYFGTKTLDTGSHGAGAAGPTSLVELRALLGIPEPDYARINEAEQKVSIQTDGMAKRVRMKGEGKNERGT